MITVIHLLVGAVIGKYVKSIWLIIIFALLSHYILDFIPHYSPSAVKGYLEGGISGADTKNLVLKSLMPFFGIILLACLIFLNKEFTGPMILGAFFAWFPDLLVFIGCQFHLDWINKIVPRHGNIFYNRNTSFLGILTQIIVFIPSIILLIFNRGKS